MKIALVEDQKYWQEEVKKKIIYFYDYDVEIKCYDTGERFLELLEEFDIVFMDIELGGEDGFAISKKYKSFYPEIILIILTTHGELWNKGYQVEAFRYIEKTKLGDIHEALTSAEVKLIQNKKIEFHIVSMGDRKMRIKDILYIETYGRHLRLHTRQGNYESIGSINALAIKLENFGFFLIHRSYIVNMEEVVNFERRKVFLKNNEVIEMSVRRYNSFKEAFFEWKFQNGNG